MATALRMLKPGDFGAFEPELKQAFRDAFHFAWDPCDESSEEQQRRKKFALAIKAARLEPAPNPARGIELMRECYALQSKICDYLSPHDRLRDELHRIAGSVSGVGEMLARLPLPAQKPAQGSPSLHGLRRAWGIVEQELRAAREKPGLDSVGDEIARLRAAASRTNDELGIVGAALAELTLEGKNSVTTGDRVAAINSIAESMGEISADLSNFCVKCTPPPEDEAGFYEYFKRLNECLPVQSWLEVVQGGSQVRTEVPIAALVVPRNLQERRAAILEWLCTQDAGFLSHLPSAARRDHHEPATKGGKGQRNWVLDGVTAALILLELVDATTDPSKATGKDLFKGTAKRVATWIAEQGRTGFFYVDGTEATSEPAESTPLTLLREIPSGETDESVDRAA